MAWSPEDSVRRILAILLFTAACWAQASNPLDQWKNLLLSGDAASLRALYSVNPDARILTPAGENTADQDVDFWTELKIKTIDIQIIESTSPQPGVEQVVFSAKLRSAAHTPSRVLYINAGQYWQKQNGQWRLIAAKRTIPSQLEMPTSTSKDIYPADADAHAEIKEALATAAKAHKRVLVVFGANWCYDCHVLDLAFHRDDLAPVVEKNYEVVHVDIGQGDRNLDLMKQYQVPIGKGIPAIAVLDAAGRLLYSQQNGEFEKARALGPEALLEFLNRWKPQPS